jgi:hypothetical protein
MTRVFDSRASVLVAHENHPQAAPGARNERGRDRQKHTGAVAGEPISRERATVTYTPKTLERGIKNRARGAPANVGDEADAARVALCAWVVEGRVHRGAPFGSDGTK